jgi:hypothetical protein
MSNSREMLEALINEDVVTAKRLINESLFTRLGQALEDKLVDFAPSVFSEGSYQLKGKNNKQESTGSVPKTSREKALAAKAPPKDKITRGDVITAAKENEKKDVNEEFDSEMLSLLESFEEELIAIVEEIQEETGEILSEEEIEEIANEYLEILKDNSEEE